MWLPVAKRSSKPRDIALDAVCCNGTIDCRCAASTNRVILPSVLLLRATDEIFVFIQSVLL